MIDQMVLCILAQAARLDQVRFQMFLKWLRSHSYQVRNPEQDPIDVEARNKEHIDRHLKNSLKTWFESLPVLGLLWEYQLILTEIRWWRSLDERSLGRILKADNEE